MDSRPGGTAARGRPLRGTPRVGFASAADGRDYRVGYRLGVLDRNSLNFELSADAQGGEPIGEMRRV